MNDSSNNQVTAQELRVLDELRRSFAFGRARNDALESRAATLVQSSSIVTGLLGAAQAATIAAPTSVQTNLLVAIFVLLLITLGCGLAIWLPIWVRHRPMEVEWDTVRTEYLEASDKDSYIRLLSTYIEAIQHEGKRNTRMANLLTGGVLGFAIQIVLWAALIALP